MRVHDIERCFRARRWFFWCQGPDSQSDHCFKHRSNRAIFTQPLRQSLRGQSKFCSPSPMRLHTKRGIRLGLAVGIELFLGYVLVAPLGGVALSELCNSYTKHICMHSICTANAGELTPLAIQVQEGCMWAAFTRSVLHHTCHQTIPVCQQDSSVRFLQASTKFRCAQDLGKSTMHRLLTKVTMSHPADIQQHMPVHMLTSCSMVITAPVVGKLSRQSLEQIIGTLVGGVLGYLTWYLAFISLHFAASPIC